VTLAEALARKLQKSGRRGETRVTETGYLSLWPKNAAIVVSGNHPGELMAIPAGTKAGAELERISRASG
jgi:hypothetical protein